MRTYVSKLYDMEWQLTLLYRLMFMLRKRRLGGPMSALVRHIIRVYCSCDIHPACRIGRRCKMPHPIGIVIGSGVSIGDDVTIWHGVTLGNAGAESENQGYPCIDAGAKIYTGATIVGPVRIGKRSVVGAHAFVCSDVPDDSVAVGIPARIATKSKDVR